MDTIVCVLGSVLTRTVVRTSSGYPLLLLGGSIVTWPRLYRVVDPPLPTSDLDWLARPRLRTQGNSLLSKDRCTELTPVALRDVWRLVRTLGTMGSIIPTGQMSLITIP